MESFITIVIWAALIQGLLLGVIFIASKKYDSFANKLLGFFLLSFVFGALTDLLPMSELWGYSLEGFFTLPEVKLLFPVLFLHFVLEKVGKSSSYILYLKIHYFLAFSIIGITLINILLLLFSGNSLLDHLGWEFLDHFFMGQQYYAFILTVTVFVIAIRETLNYRNLIRNEYTDMALLNINWLWQCIFAIAPIILFWGAELLRIILGGTGQSDLTILAYLFIAIFNYFVSYKAFTQQTLFDGSGDTFNTLKDNAPTSHKVSTAIDPEICGKIKSKMETNEYYLDQDLTLHSFAKEIQISARTISTCINQNLGMNFNEWVNNHRVDKCLVIIEADTKNQLSIEGIGFDAGFKSRSAMYEAFKKKLGHSPGHFR
jgi:AraC-like DNA-binding protein